MYYNPHMGLGTLGFDETRDPYPQKPTPLAAGVGFHGYRCGLPVVFPKNNDMLDHDVFSLQQFPKILELPNSEGNKYN
jgi:hypothetical protein